MKFLKNFGQLNEARKVNKDDVKVKVLEFLTKEKDILTQAVIAKGVGEKLEAIYGALIDLADDKKVDFVKVYDYSEDPKKWYPHYFALDVISKTEAKDMAEDLENESEEENKSRKEGKKEAVKKAIAEREEKAKSASQKRKEAAEKKEKGETAEKKPRARRTARK